MKTRFLIPLLFLLSLSPGIADQLDFKQFGLLAIQDAGRRKPVDTFAKESLLRISGQAEYKGADGNLWAPGDFLLSVLFGTKDWKKEPVVLIAYHPLAQQLGLDSARKRFSIEELSAVSQQLNSMAQQAHMLEQQKQDVDRGSKEAESVVTRLELFSHLLDTTAFTIMPPAPNSGDDHWIVPAQTNAGYPEEAFKTAADELRAMALGYANKNNFDFTLHARKLREAMRSLNPAVYPGDSLLQLEYRYNHLRPFDGAVWLYVIAFLLLVVVNASKTPRRILMTGGLGAALAGLCFHAGGIALRCIIAGRPPVTNMFESVVWVSFGIMLFGLIFFLRYRALVYILASLPVSLICLLLLRQLPVAMPESIDPLVPVLRSNFWLTIHVLTITLSYAAFALGMGFGHIVLFRFIRDPARALANATLHFWLYRVLQLGVILLAAGTILGGVWANYSWGRFWGWDPKETWALIALLCYIFVLHGRLTGWWDQFGLAVASVICFCAVVMTWYGVNFLLGKGLHSYGFGIGGEKYVYSAVVLDLAYVTLACFRYKRSRIEPPAIPAAAASVEL